MSTYLYLECLNHDPPILSNGEVGQHLSDLPHIRNLIASRKHFEKIFNLDFDISFYSNWDSTAAYFFAAHPKCDIGIRDEYGRNHQ